MTSTRTTTAAWAGVVLAAAFAVAARVPFIDWPPSRDEAGYLVVGGQWGPGTSLYGDYWVDRPPLLIGLFGLADAAGGVTALRVIGCVASVAVVLLVAWTARAAAGPGTAAGSRAAAASALVAAGLVVSPVLGGHIVNGELLAAPFVALGIGAGVHALGAGSARAAYGWSALAGAAGACAVMVKQNMVDVFVFGAVALLVALAVRRVDRATAARVVVGTLVGAVVVLLAMAAWSVSRGTDLGDLWYALYPFRLDAARTIADGGTAEVLARRESMIHRWHTGGLALLSVWVLSGAAWLRGREPVLVGVLAVLVFDIYSIVMSGGYWSHYLAQLVVPLAVGFGVLAARLTGWKQALWVLTAVSVVLAACVSVQRVAGEVPPSTSEDVGRAIAAVAEPGDTLTVMYGGCRINHAAGLPSPYPHLWGLPLRTLDPDLSTLTDLLRGPDAPTWVVVASAFDVREIDGGRVRWALTTGYDRVAVLGEHRIFLRNGVVRDAPTDSRQPEEGLRGGALLTVPRD